MSEPRSFFIKTYGCQMNVYDSDRMAEVFTRDGWRQADTPEGTDLVLLNTCHIREKAAEKVYSEVGRMRVLKEAAHAEGRQMRIAVAGCVAQAEGKEILSRAKAVDLVVGPQSYHRLPELLALNRRVVDADFAGEDKFEALRGAPRARQHDGQAGRPSPSVFLTVQEGCDKFCSFCVVPYTRGAEMSRAVGRVVEEAERLAGEGVREVTLLGQNVNAYHGLGPDGRTWSLAMLLTRLAAIEGIERLRYTTSHPRDMSADLIDLHRDLPELMPYLHLPVQSGSDRILKAMNRKHRRADYFRLVETLRRARPDLALSGDFIVGFPGETDADFEDTLQLVREVGYAAAYSFRYSPRPGTPAAERDQQLPETVQSERLRRLQALILQQQTAFNAGMIGRDIPVLVEKPGRRAGQLVGKSPWLQTVQVDAPEHLVGSIVPVAIDHIGSNTLFGTLSGERCLESQNHVDERAVA
jgi:tRNA-2-methylthio-N6-dimethylallyladenosine synthase